MWYTLQIESCLREEVEQISEALEETGALSITLTDQNDEPVWEPEPGTTPLWSVINLSALYDEEQQAMQAESRLRTLFPKQSYSINALADQDWERVWMDTFKPMCFGQRLWICPTGTEPPKPQAVNLILDPGLAFGTGTHPTTALCLSWLDQADLQQKTVIDYGCGSGILSLAALKLGAAKAYAVDIDEQALQATRNNALANAINSQQLIIDFPQALQDPVDLIIANILLAPLLNLGARFSNLLKKQGILLISGVLVEQSLELIAAYQADFHHQSTLNQEGWSLMVFTNR